MPKLPYETIRPVLGLLHATGIGRLAAPAFRGAGVIFTLHHVRPEIPRGFAPNRLLEVTPDFLDAVIGRVVERGYDLVTLDEAADRLERGGRRFVAFTLDDGYRDNVEHALPVFRRHNCPFTLFCVPDFLDGRGELWWLGLEEAVRRCDAVPDVGGEPGAMLPTRDDAEKTAAFARIYGHLRRSSNAEMFDDVRRLCAHAGFALTDLCAPLCLRWDELAQAAREPLLSVGAHTMSHPFLAKLPIDGARAEIVRSRQALEDRLGKPVTSFAYPVGDRSAAGLREFALCVEAGFRIGVTTRPGLLHREHADYPHALPRVSLNGEFQDLRFVDELLNGLPFALLNRFRRVNVD
ncbi:MAG: polysaccharide deacetylase family protein [Labrys sp. (in: a-proteobacteria)]|jgi:peptidoglycan/xylan/chitin deacetylase (PgdA/CDA1 family)